MEVWVTVKSSKVPTYHTSVSSVSYGSGFYSVYQKEAGLVTRYPQDQIVIVKEFR